MRLLLIPFILTLLAATSASAQSIANGRFIVFPRTGDSNPFQLMAGEGEFHEVTPTYGRFTKPYQIKGLSKWVIGQPATDEEGNETFETWASCNSTGGKDQTIVLFRKGPKNEDGFKAFAFNNDSQGFGKRKFLVFNMTQKDVGGIIGKKKFKLSPKGKTMVQPEEDVDENLCFSTFSVNIDGKWVNISSSNWPVFENSRAVVFVYPDPKSKKYRVHAVRDFL